MAEHQLNGACRCGQVRLEFTSPVGPEAMTPRACDCDYCARYVGVYLSHPGGRLEISSMSPLTRRRQGAEIADMLHCSSCDQLIGVVVESEGKLLGAVCLAVLGDRDAFPQAARVSPKQLSPDEKQSRWSEVWMPVSLTEGPDRGG